MFRRRFLAGLGGVLAAMTMPRWTVASGQSDDDWPREVTDALGRRIGIAGPPTRIVPVFSSNTEIVAALGGTGRIVAIDGLTRYPPEVLDRPRIGNRIGFSPDIIARLGADLVILTPARHAAAQLLRPMSLAGIPVLVLEHPTLVRILDNIGLVGRAIGSEPEAQALTRAIEDELSALAELFASRPPKRVYFETGAAGRAGFRSVRPGTYTDDILRHAGGLNVFGDRTGFSQVSGEAVFRADPDHILVAGTEADVAALLARPHWNGIRAVAAGRVDAIPRGQVLIPGPRVVEGVRTVAHALHPDLVSTSSE
ncbi:MAG: ABC transporter substrate-binding protein [Thermoanaerobaculia bacterium]|nr:ABC transporter substrate-binding protein [Thermoanaerobaculia bacterium]